MSQFLRNIYGLPPILIAPRVMLSGVKPRWLSYPSRFLPLPSVTDFSGFIAFVQTSSWFTDLDQPLPGLGVLRPKPMPGRLFPRFMLGFPLGSIPSGAEIVIR